jgi:hypothetical protein
MTDEIKNDIMGQPLEVGDVVATSERNSLRIAIIKKLNTKMVTVQFVGSRSSGGKHKYPTDVVKLDPNMATLYLLKIGN